MPEPQGPNPSARGEPFDLELSSLHYLDGVIDATEMAQLSAALKTDRASRATFIRICVHSRQFREIFGARSFSVRGESAIKEVEFETALAELVEQASRSNQASQIAIQRDAPAAKRDSGPPPAWKSYRRFYGIAASILLLVSVATTLSVWQHARQRLAEHQAGIASVEGTLDARWRGSSPSVGAPLPRTELELASGLAILHFDDGAKVVVEGPARFTPQSSGIILAAGSLSALVPASATGFTVQTASATIVDLGTEFGVRTGANGDTNLQVFKGRVSLKAAVDAQPAQVVVENSARQVSSGVASSIAFDASAMVRVEQVDKWLAAEKAAPMERWRAWSERNRRDPDMIAYYDFDNAGLSSDRLPNLASTGAALDGILQGEDGLPTWDTGRWNTKSALEFHGGTTQRVVLPDSHGTDPLDFSRGSETAKPFTIAVWVKAAPSQINSAGLVSRGLGNSGEQFTIDVFEGFFRVFVRGAAAETKVAPSGQWQYVVAVYDPVKGALSLYIDGTVAGDTNAAPHTLIPGGTPVSIGSRLAHAGTYADTLDGSIDEVAIWLRLPAEQIRENYMSGRPE